MRENIPIAVSAVSALSNCTTPVPRERPLGSYWISARSTLPMVENRSTRSSLQVDQGSCHSVSYTIPKALVRDEAQQVLTLRT